MRTKEEILKEYKYGGDKTVEHLKELVEVLIDIRDVLANLKDLLVKKE